MRMRGNRKGEAIAVMLAIMVAGGLVLWLVTGRFHRMPGHGGEKGMHKERSSPASVGPEKNSETTPPRVEEEDHPERGPGSGRDDVGPVATETYGGRYPDRWIRDAGDKIQDP